MMSSLSISSSAPAFSSKSFISSQFPSHRAKLFPLRFHPLGFRSNHGLVMKKNRRGFKAVCYSAPLAPRNLQLVCAVSSVPPKITLSLLVVSTIFSFMIILLMPYIIMLPMSSLIQSHCCLLISWVPSVLACVENFCIGGLEPGLNFRKQQKYFCGELVLMLSRGTGVQKSFLVPFFALQAPTSIISWIKGEYGTWTAFLALLVRLFFFIPGELELPFVALLLVIAAPYQVMNLRGTQAGSIVSLLIAGYLAFQHFTRAGSLQKAFDQGSVIATLAIICITVVPCLLLI